MTSNAGHIPKLLTIILDREEIKRLDEFMEEKRITHDLLLNGEGTARSEILKAIGLSETKKTWHSCIIPAFKVKSMLTAVAERFAFAKPGRGIAFIIPVSALGAKISGELAAEHAVANNERTEEMNDEATAKMELVFAIINHGFSEELMDVARGAGAGGGTVLQARGTANAHDGKFHAITLQDEREVVAILIEKELRRGLMQALSASCGHGTPANGVIMSVPVEYCIGLTPFTG